MCSGASSTSSPIARDHLVVDQDRLAEARAAVDDAVADGVDVARGLLERLDGSADSSLVDEVSFRLVEPALTTRIGRSPAQYGQAQSRIAGSSSPCSRV